MPDLRKVIATEKHNACEMPNERKKFNMQIYSANSLCLFPFLENQNAHQNIKHSQKSLFKWKLFVIVNFCLIQHTLKAYLTMEERKHFECNILTFNETIYLQNTLWKCWLVEMYYFYNVWGITCNCLMLKSKFTFCNLRPVSNMGCMSFMDLVNSYKLYVKM